MKYVKQLETKELILGKAKQSDLESVFNNYWSSEKTARFMLWNSQKNLDEAQERLNKTIEFQKNHLAFFVYEKATGEVIGQAAMIEIEPNIYEDGGVGMGEKFVGKGYGKQILNALIDYLFNKINANKIICSCHTDNIPSARLQQSCGLKYDHSEIITRKKDGLTYKSDYYVITSEDFRRKLYLSDLKKEDYAFLVKMESDPMTMDYNAGYNVSYSGYNFDDGTIAEDLTDMENNWLPKWVNHEPDKYMGILKRKSDNIPVGKVYFKEETENGHEIGIVIKGEFRGNGYATEGVALLCERADKLGIKKLFHQIPNTRKAAIKADLNNGFKVVKDNIPCEYTKFGVREQEILLIRTKAD